MLKYLLTTSQGLSRKRICQLKKAAKLTYKQCEKLQLIQLTQQSLLHDLHILYMFQMKLGTKHHELC